MAETKGDLTGFKAAIRSKTVWLALIAAGAALPRVGAHIGLLNPELLANLGGIMLDAISTLGGLLAAYTRTTATQQIRGVIETPPGNY